MLNTTKMRSYDHAPRARQLFFPSRTRARSAVTATFLALTLALLASCSSSKPAPAGAESKPAPAAPKPTELETGREAFQRLYVVGRGWAPDAGPFRLQSEVTTDADGQGGKAAVWRAFFTSVSRRALKPYIWSGSSAPGAPPRRQAGAPARPVGAGLLTEP